MEPKIIGFAGGMGAGKSTAISLIKQMYKYSVVNVKFAQPLYDIQEVIYRRISGVYERPAGFVKDRKLLQWLGTDWGRDTISPTLWVDLWRDQVEKVKRLQFPQVIVCDDVRLDNEAEAIKAAGGIVVRITRPNPEAEGGAGIKNHASESGINKSLIDFEIENNDTIDSLGEKLSRILGITR